MFLFRNNSKLFSLFQNKYQLKHTLNILVALLGLNRGNVMECQKKVLKI